MGESGSSDSWKKLVIAKTNDQWISISSLKKEHPEDAVSTTNTGDFSLDYEQSSYVIKTETVEVKDDDSIWQTDESPSTSESNSDPLAVNKIPCLKKNETVEERSVRLAKMSAYAAQRLANETPEQRAIRLRRMSLYAAKRLANESVEQRAKRLSRMSAYAAKRLAQETPEQRQARLARMSAYAARRHAMKKFNGAAMNHTQTDAEYDMAKDSQHMPNQS